MLDVFENWVGFFSENVEDAKMGIPSNESMFTVINAKFESKEDFKKDDDKKKKLLTEEEQIENEI